ncbi:sensor histidine kinase [Nocardia panacis]|uniref:histidine kinase n=1 Tax=Nocardia panacis TaxID=2340916 RepID=A0A3A4K7S7_9NOCA|nr:sensor domain-containing protein [Nocardia panacis]RJO70747.1 sensor histidine kinase [Nocardia panacis]
MPRVRTSLRDRLATPVRAAAMIGLSVAGLGAAVLVLLCAGLAVLGARGPFASAAGWLRALADAARRQARRLGVDIPRPYGPQTDAASLLKSRATWRDVGWAVLDPLAGTWAALIAAGMPLYGLYGVAQPLLWQGGTHSYGALRVNSATTALAAVPVGLAVTVLGLLLGPALLRLRARWARKLLGPSRTSALEQRVQTLVGTRADSIDTGAAELRRIERDLHDGAQARLVALGMGLGNAERLFDEDPATARALVAAARETSSKALEELRDLVRGVHPPVLSDRGLADALRALALDSLLEIDVVSDLEGRPAAPVESAVYFAISELLANAGKYAPDSAVRVLLHHSDGVLRCSIADDGPGGADPSRGTGLQGIRRRLAVFDGTIAIHSPTGGPTRVHLEVPCRIGSA